MDPLLAAAKVGHYWLSVVLVATGVLAVVALVVGYLVKVTANKHPRH